MHARLDSIQVLRAIAALSVVLYHSHFVVNPFPPEYKINIPFIYSYGYLGVDLFFAISGFIIYHITNGKTLNTAEFISKRFFRIYPVYWIFCLLSFYLYTNNGLHFGPKEFDIENLLLSMAIFPLQGSPAYGVGWSLEHEIIFYVIAALVIPALKHRGLITILTLLGAVGLIKEMLTATGAIPKFWDYHLLSPFFLSFAAGMAAYRVSVASKTNFATLTAAAIIAVLATALLMNYGSTQARIFARYAMVAISCGLVVASAVAFESTKIHIPAQLKAPIIAIGNASYSLYLVHWVILINMGRLKYKVAYGVPDWAAELWRFALIAACIAIALAMYKFIEKPLNSRASSALKLIAKKA
ncbi:acyltransferase family protein [Pseudomonas putida]|nr:acyltransferase [Pseudomonas putida]